MKSASSRPEPVVTPEFAPFWDAVGRHALEIQRCAVCRTWIHYPRVLCPHCFSDELAFEPAEGAGRVVTWSVVHRAQHPAFAAEVPYAVVVAEMAEGFRLLANVSGIELDELRIGMPVRVRFCDYANGVTLPIFVADPSARWPAARRHRDAHPTSWCAARNRSAERPAAPALRLELHLERADVGLAELRVRLLALRDAQIRIAAVEVAEADAGLELCEMAAEAEARAARRSFSSSVTRAPRRARRDASAAPMMPPPTMAIRSRRVTGCSPLLGEIRSAPILRAAIPSRSP